GGAGRRAGPGAAARLGRRRPRSDVDRHRGRHFGLRGAAPARGFSMKQDLAMSALGEFAPYALLILVGYLPNEVWRVLGAVLARGLDEDSQIIVSARVTATAILTGVVGKLVIFAPGALAGVSLTLRLGATALGLVAYLLARRSVLAGVVAATLAMMAGMLVFGG